MIKVDAAELLDVLNHMPHQQNIMLVGRHGIGKSQIITQFYENKKKMKVVPFFLGQMSDPGDLIGLMAKDEKTGHSRFLPPYWWPLEDTPILLFLDELNRARPEILQSVMDLTLNRTLAGRKLPEGSIIIAAINEGDEYQVTDLDPALVSRFNIYQFAPTVEDWLLWAGKKGLDERVLSFIRTNSGFLDADNGDEHQGIDPYGLNKTPDRRGWERVSQIIAPLKKVADIHIKIIAGVVGVRAAMHLKKSLATILEVSAEQLLLAFGKHKAKLKNFKLQDFVFTNEQLMYWLVGDNYKPVNKPAILANLHQYLCYLEKNKFREAVAHLASMLENPKFQKVTSFVLVESVDIMEDLADYIGQIDL